MTSILHDLSGFHAKGLAILWSIHRFFWFCVFFFFLTLECPPCATSMIRGCLALPATSLHSTCAAAVEYSLHLCGALLTTSLLSGVTQLACGGRPGVGAQVVCLAF